MKQKDNMKMVNKQHQKNAKNSTYKLINYNNYSMEEIYNAINKAASAKWSYARVLGWENKDDFISDITKQVYSHLNKYDETKSQISTWVWTWTENVLETRRRENEKTLKLLKADKNQYAYADEEEVKEPIEYTNIEDDLRVKEFLSKVVDKFSKKQYNILCDWLAGKEVDTKELSHIKDKLKSFGKIFEDLI